MMRFQRQAPSGSRAGFTLLEMAITVSMLGTFSMLIIETSESSSAVAEMANIEGQVFREGERAMSRILDDLRRSGSVTLGTKEYPHLFEEGQAGAGFESYDHEPGVSAAGPSDSDYGIYRSIVLCLPSDLDGDGRPELDADGDGVPELDGNGDGIPTDEGSDISGIWDPSAVTVHPTTRLSWSGQDVGYLVTATGPHGENELIRVVGGLAGEREGPCNPTSRGSSSTPPPPPAIRSRVEPSASGCSSASPHPTAGLSISVRGPRANEERMTPPRGGRAVAETRRVDRPRERRVNTRQPKTEK